MNTEYELFKKLFLNFVRTKEKYIELLSDESVDIEEIAELIVYKDEKIKELKQEVKTLQNQLKYQVNDLMKDRILNAMVKSNQVECNCTTCVCEDYVHEELKKW